MTAALMAAVGPLGEDAVQLPHPFGQIGFRGFNHQMIMIPHQTVRMAAPAKPRNNVIQDIQECGAVLIFAKDRLLPVATGSDVLECAWILDS
jgi:hypothetical protein